jgi:hypothetical protein
MFRLFCKKPKASSDSPSASTVNTDDSDRLTPEKYKPLHKANRTELLEYYKILREMIKNFNNMILDVSLRGGTLLLALIAASAYLPSKNGDSPSLVSLFFSFLVVIAALVLSNHLHNQVKFFTGMLRSTLQITRQVEATLLTYEVETGLTTPDELLVSYELHRRFPGHKYIAKLRERFFPYMMFFLWAYLAALIVLAWANHHERMSEFFCRYIAPTLGALF